MVFFPLHSNLDVRSLKKSSFAFSEDAKGDHFVSVAHDEATKNHQGVPVFLM